MDSIRAMRDQLTRSSKSMQETIDSVLAKVEEHDKALQQKLSSSPSRTQTSNTTVPPATVVPPIVHPQYGIPAPVPPNHLYNPNAYFNPVVPPVPFVHPPPMVIGPPPYHPPTVHSSAINPSSTLPTTSHTSSNLSYCSSSRDVLPLSSPLHDSDETSLKEVVGATKSSSLHVEGSPDHQKPLHAGNDGNGDSSDGDDNTASDGDHRCQQNDQRHDDHGGQQNINPSQAQLLYTQIPSAVPEHVNCYQENINRFSQTLFSEGRKDDQTYCKSCKTNVDNQSLRATTVSERVKLLKQSMNAIQTSMKERSEAFERKVDAILTKVEENERMLQMKFPWLKTVMSKVDVPSIQYIHHVISGPARLPIDPHLKAIPDMNSSPIIPINHMNSNPRIVLVGATWNPKSGPSCDNSSSNPKTVPICPHQYPKSNSRCDMNSFSPLSYLCIPHTIMAITKSYISSSCTSSLCERQMSDTSVEFPCNIKFPSTTKYKDHECFPQFPTEDGNVYSISIAPCIKCNQPTQGSLHQQHSNIYVNSSLAGCIACECKYNVNEQLFGIEDIDDSDLRSGNIPELEYLKSLSRPIMSPDQSCMRSFSPEYVLGIPMKRRKGFEIPNVSNKNDRYHCIHQYCHHDATPALDSRLYDRGRSYNKGQSYDRGWNCIPPKTCSTFIPSVHLTH